MQRSWWLAVLLLGLMVLPASAKRTVSDDEPIELRLELFQMTTVVLPEHISSATTALKKEVLMVGEDGAILTVAPLHPDIPPGRIVVVGAQTGKPYLLRYKLVPAKSDDEVSVTRGSTKTTMPATPLTLLRAMLAAPASPLQVPGVKPRAEASAFIPVPRADDARVITGASQLETVNGTLHALRVELRNTQLHALRLNIQVGEPGTMAPDPQVVALDLWAWPPKQTIAVLYVDEDVLPPGGATTLYVVYEER